MHVVLQRREWCSYACTPARASRGARSRSAGVRSVRSVPCCRRQWPGADAKRGGRHWTAGTSSSPMACGGPQPPRDTLWHWARVCDSQARRRPATQTPSAANECSLGMSPRAARGRQVPVPVPAMTPSEAKTRGRGRRQRKPGRHLPSHGGCRQQRAQLPQSTVTQHAAVRRTATATATAARGPWMRMRRRQSRRQLESSRRQKRPQGQHKFHTEANMSKWVQPRFYAWRFCRAGVGCTQLVRN